ncbi:glycosyltransferase family 2 protein [Echinicola rosea]|uniref:Glycosyltransferase 2-like domain-containing protein n=1 Tax=Echinicola rosea TaxID=1807691 RepID=A0ABQ1VBE2_9BACT|nr:glycosyltransferase family 2 protein [Echinicola rosea]GGF51622.1 hypothetical protein GCM10011339_45200 [Echinicola rosea]
MDKVKVSIIIPCFNSEHYIGETLTYILNQSYSEWECLCIDDGSTDNSISIVRDFISIDSRFKIFKRPSHMKKGGNSCRNYGFQLATGEYIQWFDSDDLMHEKMLEEKVKALDRNSSVNYVVCHTGYFNNDDSSKVVPYDQNLNSTDFYFDYLTFKVKIFTPGPMFRKAFLDSMDLFNISLKRHQEKEFFFRIILRDKMFLVLDDIFVFRRMHEAQLSSSANSSSNKLKMEFYANKINYRSFVFSDLSDSKVLSYFRGFFLRYTYRLFREGKILISVKCFMVYLQSLLKIAVF